jgi:Mg2+-importing ATPase
MGRNTPKAGWTASSEKLHRMMKARPEGLTTAEAGERLRRFGPNLPVVSARSSVLARLGRRLTEPRVAILPIAAAISGATGDRQSLCCLVSLDR